MTSTDFTVLLLQGAYASSVALTLDLLGAGRAVAERAGQPGPRWRLVSIDGGRLDLQGGMSLQTLRAQASHAGDGSIWIVPGLGLDSATALSERLAQPDALAAAGLLRAHGRKGGAVAASCSAVFLLQRAGLLAGRRVSTAWWLAAQLQRLEPGCQVQAERMVCADGPLLTAGAAMAQSDLMLHLLRTRLGEDLAEAVARVLLIDARQAQAPFVVPELLASGDELISQLTRKISQALPSPPSAEEMARDLCMSTRTLSRHVQRATGQGTLALVQSVRLQHARQLLQRSRMSVEQVAAAVGYQDATALRRLLRKSAGLTPSRLRA